MQEQDDRSVDPDTVLGRVRDIRRKWAVQEDEALAYRLQDEEIAHHYNHNRTRNAIVREDAPRAREAQRQEELQAVEERLKHLNLLQQQAEEDARLAKILAMRDGEAPKAKKQPQSPTQKRDKSPTVTASPPRLSPRTREHVCEVDMHVALSHRSHSPLLGAGAPAAEPGPSRSFYSKNEAKQYYEEDEEDLRVLQEEKDAAVARALQEELDRAERDKLLALEVQDRELAKMIHEKERARYKRAKEKARLKAEAMAAAEAAEKGEMPEGHDAVMVRAASRSSTSSERSSKAGEMMPPKIPEKQKSPTAEEIGFRANPKPLPPHPLTAVHEFDSIAPPPPIRMEHRRLPLDPVPPYMPIHGYNRNSPKRNK